MSHRIWFSWEFTSINVCTINNKCRFKGILARRFFICILFSSWHFQISFTPCYKCHHIGWNWLISNKFNLAPLSHTFKSSRGGKKKMYDDLFWLSGGWIYLGHVSSISDTSQIYLPAHFWSGLVSHSRDFQDLSQRIRWFLRKSWSLTRMDNGCWKVEAGLGEDQFIFLFSLVMLPTLEQQLFQSSQRGPWPGLDQSEASILVTWSVLANQRPVSWSRDQGWPSCNFIPSPR